MQIIKVIMTYDYWICRPLLALNPCKVYQIMYAIVHSYSCKCMRNKYPICMKCPHTSHVEGDQFLNSQNAWACWDVVARAIIFEIPSDHWQSNVHVPWPNERTISPDCGFQTPITAVLFAYLLHEFIVNVKFFRAQNLR